MKSIFTPLLAFLLAATVHAQIPSVAWTRSLGSSYSDAGYFVHQLPDKSFFLAGMSGSADGQLSNTTGPVNGGVLFVGLDSLGDMQWGRRTGDPGYAWIWHGAAMTDGNFVFTGNIFDTVNVVPPYDGDHELWIVKVSPAGSTIWQRSYNVVDHQDIGRHVSAGPNGSCIVAGEKIVNSWDVWVIALDSEGDELWSGTYGGSGPDFGRSIVATADGGALLAAWTGSIDGDVNTPLLGVYDGWLAKLDASGSIAWARTYGGSGSDYFQDVLPMDDGGFLVIGTSNSSNGDLTSNNGGSDVWLLRVSASGDVLWSKSYGGSLLDSPRSIIPFEGNYLIAGTTYSSNGDVSVSYHPPSGTSNEGDGWLLLVSPSGELLWEKTVGGSSWDSFYALAPTDDGFIATGVSNSTDHFVPSNVAYGDIWTVRFNSKSTLLAGTLYVDADNDSIIDVADPRIGGRLVELSSNDELALSQPNGRYVFATNGPAQHTISGPAIPYFIKDPDTRTASITGQEPAVSGFDFRYTAGAPAQDLQVFLTPISAFRPGFPVRYEVLCRNVGTMTMDADLSLVLDDGLGFDSTSIAPASVTGNTLSWALGPMLPLQNIQLSVYCTQSVADTLGSPVTTTAEITPIVGDLVPADNTVTTNNQVVGSFDPNDILVDPTEVLVDDLADAVLDYTIRFQNTGTDTAFTVAVENLLPANAYLPSFEVICSSHPVALTYYDFAHKMRFQFDDILLPDSNVNELMSHGFLRYRIRPRNDLMIGDSILNSAAIFFDFNAPVITNTAVTEIINQTGVSAGGTNYDLPVSPNPTTGWVVLRIGEGLMGAGWRVMDTMGRVVLMGQAMSGREEIDLSALPTGAYSIALTSGNGWSRARVIKQ